MRMNHARLPPIEIARRPLGPRSFARVGLLASALATSSAAACESARGGGPEVSSLSAPTPPSEPSSSEAVVVSPVPPFPISGGTLLVVAETDQAVVSDPDRDRVVLVDLAEGSVRAVVPTEVRARPGRAASDGARAYVTLRGAGRITTIDLSSGAELSSIDVCAAPIGVAFDPGEAQILVACEGGELVTLDAGATPSVVHVARLEPDLRDVVVAGSRLFVSHFRSARVDLVDEHGAVIGAATPSGYHSPSQLAFSAGVAWRMIATADEHVVVVHQRERDGDVPIAVPEAPPGQGASSSKALGPYGSPLCRSSVVHAAVDVFAPSGEPLTKAGAGGLANMTLPVDVAASRSSGRLAVLSAATGSIVEGPEAALHAFDGCSDELPAAKSGDGGSSGMTAAGLRKLTSASEPIAIAYGRGDAVVVQTREPATLQIFADDANEPVRAIALGGESRRDDAHALFHGVRGESGTSAIACASCHPEGREDGRVWRLGGKKRRTQSLAGFSLETAPFHWEGDLADVPALVDQVLVERMGGAKQSPARADALASWLTQIPPVVSSDALDPSAVARGRALFDDPEVACSSCHGGPRLTDDQTLDVGTGGAFQVPSLVGVAARAPYMHDGCARTLLERFTPSCGGGDRHGRTSQLDAGALDDLVAYLRSL